jgi:Rho-binding antiterminator
MEDTYKPIDCGFYDVLTLFALHRNVVSIKFKKLDTKHSMSETEDVIDDIYTKESAEFMRLKNGMILRLDQVIEINKR